VWDSLLIIIGAFAIFWIYSPLYAPISYRRDANETGFHIVLFVWFTRKLGYTSWGLMWVLYYPVSAICYLQTEHKLIHFVLPLYIIYNNRRYNVWRVFLLMGCIYASTKEKATEFRLFYRYSKGRSVSHILKAFPYKIWR
jgi:hypothetical protein